MGKRKKKRIRIKKKNFILFILFLILLFYAISKIIYITIKLIETSKPIEKEEPKVIEKTLTPTEKKLKELDNINKKIDYFHMDYLDRYLNYKEKNEDLEIIQIIKNVNMNLDYNYYENTEKALNKDTPLILVNKHYSLEENDIPNNLETVSNNYALDDVKLVSIAKEAFESLAKDAQKENLNIVGMSGYRSYQYQTNLYNNYVNKDGKEAADTYSGRPGHSEHQTGYALDVYNLKENYTNFENTKEFTWMQEHAQDYGFILRFPKNKELETGYIYESWHYRYVGVEVAKEIKEKGITLEEYIATRPIQQ